MELWSVCLILFLIIDPLGKVSSFLRILEKVPPERKKIVIAREMGIALALIFLFNFIGEYVFSFLGIHDIAVHLSAGLILFLSALRILFPTMKDKEPKTPEGEPFLVPLAVPLIASPALLATVMLFAHIEPKMITMIVAILVSWAAAFLILINSSTMFKILGKNGLLGIERLMGMVLVMLAVQRFIEGLTLFVNTYLKT